MDTISEFKKKSNGIYPILPGMTIKLGDYGLWEKSSWQRFGNIETDFKDIFFCTKNQPVNQNLEVLIDSRRIGSNKTNLQVPEIQSECEIEFKTKGSIFFNADICSEEYYTSLDHEIKPFLKDLFENNLWNEKYWIVVSIVYSTNYICIQSNKNNSKISLGINTDNISLANVSNKFTIKNENGSITKTQSLDNKKKPVGMRFISFQKESLFSKNRVLKYQGSSNELDFNDISEEEFY